MKMLENPLAAHAAHHRDARDVATRFAGMPPPRGPGLPTNGLLGLAAALGAWASGLPRAGWRATGVGGFVDAWIFRAPDATP